MQVFGGARRRASRAVRIAGAVGAASMLMACYDYSAPADPVARPASELRLTLTDAGSVELASQVGPRVESLDGRVERATRDTVVVAVARTVARDGRETEWRGEPVTVVTRQVATVRERRLSTGRTALAAAVGVGAAIGILLAAHGSSSSSASGAPVTPGAPQ